MQMRCLQSEDRSLQSLLDYVPERVVRRKFGQRVRRSASPELSQALIEAMIEHAIVNFKHHGPLSTLFNGTCHYICLAKNTLMSEERLLNPDINFPIGVVFGDSDFLGSEGADEIVKKSKFFDSGESQLFKLENSGHNMYWHNPDGLAKMMAAFF